MVLTLSTSAVPPPRERCVIPPCLQPRAPLSYELRDEHDRRIAPTLVGYKLRRGKTYRLRVVTQEQTAAGWRLRLVAPRSVVHTQAPDEPDGNRRALSFDIGSPLSHDWLNLIRSEVRSLPVTLNFDNGRDPYHFEIPVVLLASRFVRFGSFLATALLSFLAAGIFKETPSLPSATNLGLFGGAWAAIFLGCFAWDQIKFYGQACQRVAACADPSMT
jgi:hypothetical protein